ncbi:DUF6134 family protein [Acidovorax sp. NCPPB 2350]|nr:DUF6134 family protein [Acidovorax sp. NCPPB 2350]
MTPRPGATGRARHAMACALLAGLALTGSPAHALGPAEGIWNFSVTLDDRPIGEHRFRLATQESGERSVESTARFTVRVMGIALYRYRHEARELWRGDCLVKITSDTDDDGQPGAVQQEFMPGSAGTACTRSFAYWNPAILDSRELLDPQTGKIEPVRISRQQEDTLTVRGQAVAAVRWRIEGPKHPIDVWYATGSGEWVGLDSTVRGGRKLRYRLP